MNHGRITSIGILKLSSDCPPVNIGNGVFVLKDEHRIHHTKWVLLRCVVEQLETGILPDTNTVIENYRRLFHHYYEPY